MKRFELKDGYILEDGEQISINQAVKELNRLYARNILLEKLEDFDVRNWFNYGAAQREFELDMNYLREPVE